METTAKSAVVPMRFYANWDVDRTSSSAIPRTLSMKFTRLSLTKALPTENAFIIAVKLQGHRRILRSNDITIPSSSRLDYALDISFTIQYCHFIKRKSNVLDIFIQRRKKYKNRQIPGFKTLAFGNINLDEILQFGGSREISIWDTACLKRLSVQDFHAGIIYISNCQSQVADSGELDTGKWVLKSNGFSNKYGNILSEEEVDDYSSQEDSDFEDFDQRPRNHQSDHNKRSRKKIKQKNIKQKVVALLKKFRVPDEEGNTPTIAGSTSSHVQPPTELELQEIFEELENISDSGPEVEPDKMSIVSNPRPRLRPFFGSKSDNLPAIKDDQIHSDDSVGDSDEPDQESSEETAKESCFWVQDLPSGSGVGTSSPFPVESAFDSKFHQRSTIADSNSPHQQSTSHAGASHGVQNSREKLKHSLTINSITSEGGRPANAGGNLPSARSLASGKSIDKKSIDNSMFLEMMSRFDAGGGSTLSLVPYNIWLTSSVDFSWVQRVDRSKLENVYLFDCPNLAEVRTAIHAIIGRIQKFCNSNSAAPSTTRLGIFGCDKLVSQVLRTYVDLLQNKACQDWLDYLRFSIITPPGSAIGRFINQLPAMDGYLESIWRGGVGSLARISLAFENGSATFADHQELGSCLASITSGNSTSQQRLLNLSIGEVMLQLESTAISSSSMLEERDNSQVFVPFISELYMGSMDEYSGSMTTKSSADECSNPVNSAPPIVSSASQNAFPSFSAITGNLSPPISPHPKSTSDCKEVHVEYWTCSSAATNQPQASALSQDYFYPSATPRSTLLSTSSGANSAAAALAQSCSAKFSLKATVRNLCVAREPTTNSLCILFVKEKKKDKVLQKLGRKNKQKSPGDFLNSQSRLVSSVTRMVCSSGNSGKNALLLDVTIDGVAWRRIRYFQVSSQWQTHVKLFPISFPM